MLAENRGICLDQGMPTVYVDNAEMYYESYGKGYPLLLIPGLGGNMEVSWKGITPELSKRYRVITFDNRGTGKGIQNGDLITIERMMEDVMGLITALDLNAPHVFGHSMGGIIAQRLGVKYGNRLGRIILSNTFLELNAVAKVAVNAAISLLDIGVPTEKVLWTLAPWFFSSDFLAKEENLNRLDKVYKTLQFPLEGFKRQYEALKNHKMCENLDKIPNHVLVIASEDDLLIPHYEAGEVAERLYDVRLIIMKGGHASIIENPTSIVEIIEDFLV